MYRRLALANLDTRWKHPFELATMADAAAAREHPESRPADPQTGATSLGIRPRVLSAIRYLTAHNKTTANCDVS